jgi:hypothetical protein
VSDCDARVLKRNPVKQASSNSSKSVRLMPPSKKLDV